MEDVIHPKETRRKPSLVPNTWFFDVLVKKNIIKDRGITIKRVLRKEKTVSISKYRNATTADININIEIISNNTERTCRTIFIFTLQEFLLVFL